MDIFAVILLIISVSTVEGQVYSTFLCDFESSSICGFTQLSDDDFNWSRKIGRTSSSNTGPTKAYKGHYYMYVETSSPRQLYDKARLQTPTLASSGCNTLTMAFHAYGTHLGVFKVKKLEGTTEQTLWQFYTAHQNYSSQDSWRRIKLPFNASSNYKIIIEASRGTSYRGDYAFDDFQIKPDLACTETEPTLTALLNVFCDFEAVFCGFQNSGLWYWSVSRYYSFISGSGPRYSLSGSRYAHVSSSYQSVGSIARLSSFVIEGSSNCMNLTFLYNARGNDLGNLSVIQEFPYDAEPDVLLWNRTGPNVDELANYWKEVRLPLNSKSKNFKIVFQVRQMHYGALGNYAIDRVSITSTTSSSCNNYNPSSTPYYYSPYTCDFEGDVCGMTTSGSISDQWKHVSVGDHASYNSSIRRDASSTSVNRQFMYLPAVNLGIPRLLTPIINLRTHCLEISFQCMSQSFGHLNVLVINGTSRVIETVQCGYSYTLWSIHAKTIAYPYRRNFQIGFESANSSSIGLDNIKVRGVTCIQPTTTTPYYSTTPTLIRYLYSTSGYIQSPNYPSHYHNNINYYWYIRLSSRYSSISFQFMYFQTEANTACSFDYIMIHGRKYCGTRAGSISIPGHSINVYFHTDGSITKRGFRIFYQGFLTGMTTFPTNTGLSQTLYSDSGTLMSPNYPYNYPNNYQYHWYIKPVNVPSQIRFIFINFNTYAPSSALCSSTSADYVQISSSSRQSTKFCGFKSLTTFTTQGNTATVLFKTNGSIRRNGFIINYVAIAGSVATTTPTVPTNNGITSLYNYYGTITSPYYPNNYRSRYKHTWIVRPYNRPTQIVFKFSYFQTESCSDYLQIYTTYKSGSRKYCGTMTGTIKTIYRSSAYIYFYTDSRVTYRGFSISYQTLGGTKGTTVPPHSTSSPGQQTIRLIPHTTGFIRSPHYPNGYPSSGQSFIWNFTGSNEVRSISFKFIDIDLPQHCLDFVTIGKHKLCEMSHNKNISLSGRNSTVIFNIGSVDLKIGYYRGFVLRYYAHAQDLGTTALRKATSEKDDNKLMPLYYSLGVLGCILLVCAIIATFCYMKSVNTRRPVPPPVNYNNQTRVAHVNPPMVQGAGAAPYPRQAAPLPQDEKHGDPTVQYTPGYDNPAYTSMNDVPSPPSYDTLSYHGSQMFPHPPQHRNGQLPPLSIAALTPLDTGVANVQLPILAQPNTGNQARLPPIHVTPRNDDTTEVEATAPPPDYERMTTIPPQPDNTYDTLK